VFGGEDDRPSAVFSVFSGNLPLKSLRKIIMVIMLVMISVAYRGWAEGFYGQKQVVGNEDQDA